MRYHLIDRIEELQPFKYAIGVKCISLSDDCFEQHFPGEPIYPGALLLEAMAQLGGAMLEVSMRDTEGNSPRCVLSSVKAKFRGFARPGDRLIMRADVVSHHPDSALVRTSGSRDSEHICEAEIVFVYVNPESPRLTAGRKDFLADVTRATRMIP